MPKLIYTSCDTRPHGYLYHYDLRAGMASATPCLPTLDSRRIPDTSAGQCRFVTSERLHVEVLVRCLMPYWSNGAVAERPSQTVRVRMGSMPCKRLMLLESGRTFERVLQRTDKYRVTPQSFFMYAHSYLSIYVYIYTYTTNCKERYMSVA